MAGQRTSNQHKIKFHVTDNESGNVKKDKHKFIRRLFFTLNFIVNTLNFPRFDIAPYVFVLATQQSSPSCAYRCEYLLPSHQRHAVSQIVVTRKRPGIILKKSERFIYRRGF